MGKNSCSVEKQLCVVVCLQQLISKDTHKLSRVRVGFSMKVQVVSE